MNTIKLNNTHRFERGVIGATALAGVLMVPGLSETSLFTLAMVGFYTSLTAVLNADLFHAVFKPIGDSPQTAGETGDGAVEQGAAIYKKAA